MSRLSNTVIYAALILSAMTLSACASKEEPAPVAVTAPVEAVVEKAPVAEVTPAPVVVAEQPAVKAAPVAKHKIRKAKKVAKKVEPVAPPPAPVVAPAPVEEYKAPVVATPEPAPAVVEAPAPVKEEPGFLAQYWMWLVGLLVVIIGFVAWILKNRE